MKTLFTVILFFLANILFSQEFQGIATYRSSQQFTLKLDSTEVSSTEMNDLQEQLKKEFEKDYTLKFNKKESVYQMVEELQLDDPKAGNSKMIVVGSSTNDLPLYKNLAEKIYLKEEDLMGKRFLIKDELKLPDWKMANEQKNIGEYTCFKAIWTRDDVITQYDKDKGPITKTVERTTIAWYTPEIPISHGPMEYWGLPGLILEIQEDKYSLLCTGIILNPSEKFQLEIPSKGKEIDQVTYDKIQTEKQKAMMEQFGKGRDKGTIKIRG